MAYPGSCIARRSGEASPLLVRLRRDDKVGYHQRKSAEDQTTAGLPRWHNTDKSYRRRPESEADTVSGPNKNTAARV